MDRRWAISHDAADQLRSVISYSGTSSIVLEKWGYAYDPAGNRSYEEHDGTGIPTTTANANRLLQRGGAGSIRVSGTIDKAATVTVNGQPARVTSTAGAAPFVFEKDLAVATGAQTFTIAATDGSGLPPTTQTYSITIPATHQTYEHDLNGNLRHIRSGGTTVVRSYEWDAADRLVKIVYADNGSTTFQYDGMSQRRLITEYAPDGTTVTSTTRLLWLNGRVWQEQDASARVTRRYHFNGTQTLTYTGSATTPTNITSTLTMTDHLGSHREVVTLVSGVPTLIGRRDYDPYGKATQVGVVPTNAAYTGHWLHDRSGLELALYRAYDAELGRWLNEDPIGERGGLNLYGYVGNSPISWFDPLGLDPCGGYANGTGNSSSDINSFQDRAQQGAKASCTFGFASPTQLMDALKNASKPVTRLDLHGHGVTWAFFTGDPAARVTEPDFNNLASAIADGSINMPKNSSIRLFACNQGENAQKLAKKLGELGRGDIKVTGAWSPVSPNSSETRANGTFRTYQGGSQTGSSSSIPYR